MKTKYLTSLVLLLVACSGGQTTGGSGGESQVQLKKAAADANASHTAQGDACQEHGWYGDGECDRFCSVVDSVDCTPTTGDDGGVVCALFIEEANGVCSRPPTDPCISQDPDCDDIICTAIAKEADGKCDPSDPCAVYQDPDCSAAPPMPTEPPGGEPIICTAIAKEADGKCDPSDPCAVYQDPDCAPGGTPPTDPPGSTPPAPPADPGPEPVACALYIELSDGQCKREPSDPCIFQDPDCVTK